MSTLVVAEHRLGVTRTVTAEAVTAALQLGEPVSLAVLSSDPAGLALGFEGVDEAVHVRVDAPEFNADVWLDALVALVEERRPRVVILPFSVNSMSYAAALAVRTGGGLATDVHALAVDGDSVVATRSFYGGKVHAELELSPPSVVAIRAGAWPPAVESEAADVTEFDAVGGLTSRIKLVEFVEPETGGVDITAADFVLAVGRGIGDQENLPSLEELATKLGAVLAVSRPLVDAGWVSNVRQVGQSGKTVKPKAYLALGISGAVQHVAGMRDSSLIIAVNTDPEAAIFSVAHYGAVADLFDVAEELSSIS